ncbi:RNA polymerase sigma factor [Actinoplanes sp. LDG1-01]|uniref:RNA polymerase sigma factor n=1 Tax=Paractinoplanes lichenicola TaxID=2802976 RepID=A0ABS1W1B7_9ACTN|nr:RNA polymerase sigma factor [Actinoplanes lichenicola]
MRIERVQRLPGPRVHGLPSPAPHLLLGVFRDGPLVPREQWRHLAVGEAQQPYAVVVGIVRREPVEHEEPLAVGRERVRLDTAGQGELVVPVGPDHQQRRRGAADRWIGGPRAGQHAGVAGLGDHPGHPATPDRLLLEGCPGRRVDPHQLARVRDGTVPAQHRPGAQGPSLGAREPDDTVAAPGQHHIGNRGGGRLRPAATGHGGEHSTGEGEERTACGHALQTPRIGIRFREPFRARRCQCSVGARQKEPGLREAIEIDDATAVSRARSGDLGAYEVLVARYTVPAHRAAVLLGAGDDADDVVQEALVKAYRQLSRYRGESGFRPWLLAIVANETRNLHRSRRRRDGLVLRAAAVTEPAPDEPGPADTVLARERRERLIGNLRSLAQRDQDVLVCRYLLDLSEQETAAALGVPKGTVKSRTARALARLREHLRAEEVPDA